MHETFSISDPEIPDGLRRLILVLGDQLDPLTLDRLDFDPEHDLVAMFEVAEEATHVPSHKARTALFLAAMRHHALALAEGPAKDRLLYVCLDDPENRGSFASELRRLAERLASEEVTIERLAFVRPGEWRVLDALEDVASDLKWSIEQIEDHHFLTDLDAFESWAAGRKELVMEYFYRWQRRRLNLLMDGKDPAGGRWNFDQENRQPLNDEAPSPNDPLQFAPDAITREVLELVNRAFPDAPGSTASFGWPVRRDQALEALDQFLDDRLCHFGPYQDAMRTGEPWVFHSLLSPALNLKLLDPREVVDAAVARWRDGDAPLQSVEGFVRQIVGWREYVRCIYWSQGRGYRQRNHLRQNGDLPAAYWGADTDMTCLRESLGQVFKHGYGHHIQRLMVTGVYALMAGAHPKNVSDWYLGMYVDAVDWVTLPNTLGMVMYADGGVLGTKPYVASGNYISRMSDYCSHCRFDPKAKTGEDACPFTVLYWDFLRRHRPALEGNRRMGWVWKNLERIDEETTRGITARARELRTDSD
ncbi:MAG: cryptochrome/photolyase family protein [Acidobacteriota bacterium]